MRIFYSILFILTIVVLYSCEELLEVPDISGEEVMLLAPTDSTEVLQANVNFTWNEVFEATSYHVQVAQPSFLAASQIVVDTLVVVDSAYVGTRFTKILINNGYEWRVKALNSDFETEYTTHSFTVKTSGN